ncbi:MAG TPA: ROK family transcriptional regulator [Planctomycetota bacterium]|nr:ROK family transcriptional regulator [Planctomycetota bacterium]
MAPNPATRLTSRVVPEARGNRPRRGNARTIREVNDLLVLNCLREHQPIASIDIARKLHMEPATVCKVMRRLTEAGFVREGDVGQAGPRGGRRPRLLHLEERARLIIGIDMGYPGGRGIVMDLGGKVLHRVSEAAVPDPAEGVLSIVGQLLARLSRKEREKVAGVGIGAHDAVYEAGVMLAPGGRVPVAEMVARRFGVDAFVDENTNAFAMAEKHFGFGHGASSFLCLWYRHGVGHALVIDGKLFRGAHNSFGETRHYVIPDRPENSPEDPVGTVEVRPQAITAIAARLAREAGPFLTAALQKDSKERPEEVIAAVAQGIEAQDPATMKAVDEIARAMSVSTSLLGDLFDPEVLIIGGPVTRWGAPMLELLRGHVAELADTTATREGPPRLEFTRLGDDVIALGGAALVMERLFEAVGITVAP